jgi:hypothetical protein
MNATKLLQPCQLSKIVFLHDFFKREPFAIQIYLLYADFECILKNVDTCLPQPSMSSPPCIIVSYFILNRSHFFMTAWYVIFM